MLSNKNDREHLLENYINCIDPQISMQNRLIIEKAFPSELNVNAQADKLVGHAELLANDQGFL